MEQSKIDRINELARKSRIAPLTEEELAEQKRLREEYVSAFRRSLEAQLDRIYIIDEKGQKRKLRENDC
ncbi:MAG TPA: DUF896 domain-containing protein [Clostridiales bacterium]|jgi:uncharacterized protein YnzC (UPF0291/DUF896 family)|nr:DUF896 domain-containing protein [Clostridiales bacterium]